NQPHSQGTCCGCGRGQEYGQGVRDAYFRKPRIEGYRSVNQPESSYHERIYFGWCSDRGL
ncbi:hypothetical protein P0E55_13900, partial [Enterococcus faecalis]|uniref:hypothetical protein n=1 Tax=Enterococcus faecalis TaxID=1351 RepID=UPI0025B23BE1